MASSLNKVELIGRLGADPEVKNLNNGAVANLRSPPASLEGPRR